MPLPPNEDAVLTLNVESVGLHDVPVVDSGSDEDLDEGVFTCRRRRLWDDERDQKTST